MTRLVIPDMTCGHCVSVITSAVKSEDRHAVLDFDLRQHTLRIRSTADDADLIAAIEATGYAVSRSASTSGPARQELAENH